ncbi:MAG: carboxypeptidase regulatory-like domain-containing protein [Anaerolineaceae bacterium]|nr:carboxypeptidase regulatory-like domain-containing protein [Anaerolineaceae bacterium]
MTLIRHLAPPGQTAVTTLDPNENDPTWDGGLYAQPASIGNYVWLDANQDGLQDADEFGIPGITVNLYNGSGTFIGTTTTGAFGSYGFTNLPPGDYYVEVIATGYTITQQNQGSDEALDSDIDTTTGETAVTTLIAGENDPTWDGGLYIIPASLGDLVWLDANQDGLQDADEFGVPNVTVHLYDSGDNLLDTTSTDAYGNYSFTNLTPGDYYVAVVPPTGYTITSQDAGDDALDSDIDATTGQTSVINLASGENDPTWDGGIYTPPASLGDTVWLDADLNGTQDFNEGGVIAVTVSLYDGSGNLLDSTATNATGFYEFTNLPPGSYYVDVTLPNGYAFTTQDASGDDATDSDVDTTTGETIVTTLIAGENDPTWDAGLVPAIASLGDYVWEDLNGDGLQDVGEPGVQGVTVYLYDITDTQIMTATTDVNGRYTFIDLTPGTYHVEFVLPVGYSFTLQNQGADPAADSDADTTTGLTIPTVLTPGENDVSWDAGLVQPLNPLLAALGNYVWEDLDGDGIQDAGEPGVENVTVNLYDTGGFVDTTTTDANGLYQFIDLVPGDYHVEFILPAGYDFTQQDQGASDTADSDADTTTGLTIQTNLVAGENDTTWDAGLIQQLNPALAAIGNYVWLDADEDGLQDIGEPGIENVTVNLYDSNDVLTGTTSTDANGLYQFIDLTPGDYYVEFVPPTGYILTGQDQGADDALDSDADANIFSATFGQTIPTNLVAGENDTTWDAGLYIPSAPSTASLGDFVWLDVNVDGVQDGGESGVENVTVNLYTSGDVLVDTTTTDATGFYQFTNLLPGDYYVGFMPPANYALTFANSGVTDLDDSDADPVSGQTAVTTLTAGENDPTWDAGLYQTLRLGNRVWFDVDNDGILDAGEQPVPGVVMELLDGVGNPVILPASSQPLTTTTSTDGIYLFDSLPAGDYIVRVAASNFDEWTDPLYGFVSSRSNLAVDPAVDPDSNQSDVDDNGRNNPDPANGGIVSYPVTLTVGGEPTNEGADEDGDFPNADSNLTVDFGFFERLTLGNYIWLDNNENSTIDPGEPGVGGVIVYLLDGNGNPIRHPQTNQPIQTSTNQSGYYQFTNLYPGEYRVLVGAENFQPGGALEGYWSSPGAVDPDDNSDIDDNGVDEEKPWDTGIVSRAVRLDYDLEPRNNDDTDDNDNTNLTVDMGFVATPTAVSLTSFSATNLGNQQVRINWTTASELDNFGFRLYRSSSNSFAGATQIHFEPTAVPNGTGPGASYSYTDDVPGTGTYYYWLVDVETDGDTAVHGPAIANVTPFFNVYLPLVIGGN